MTVADQVRKAPDQQTALIAIAEALDWLLEHEAQTDDGWGGKAWADAAAFNDDLTARVIEPMREATSQPASLLPVLTPEVADQLQQLAVELSRAPDDNASEQIRAQMRLLCDPGVRPPEEPQGTRPRVEEGRDEVMITVPSVDAKRYRNRQQLAESMDLSGNYGPGENWSEVYAKGGPLWLYGEDREFVMTLPQDMRAEMVADVAVDSAAEAHELARDILKIDEAQLPDFTPDT